MRAALSLTCLLGGFLTVDAYTTGGDSMQMPASVKQKAAEVVADEEAPCEGYMCEWWLNETEVKSMAVDDDDGSVVAADTKHGDKNQQGKNQQGKNQQGAQGSQNKHQAAKPEHQAAKPENQAAKAEAIKSGMWDRLEKAKKRRQGKISDDDADAIELMDVEEDARMHTPASTMDLEGPSSQAQHPESLVRKAAAAAAARGHQRSLSGSPK